MYGDNEELLAKWFQKTGKRDEIFLASKFGYVTHSGPMEINSSAEYTKKACYSTLKKLGIDHIDLCESCPREEYLYILFVWPIFSDNSIC